MQTAGHFVGLVVELAARVQFAEHYFERANAFGGVHADGDADSVIGYRQTFVRVNRDGDVVASAGHRFVDRVVDDFPHQVVQASRRRVADVHAGSFPNRFEPFEDANIALVVDIVIVVGGEIICLFLGHSAIPFIRGCKRKTPAEPQQNWGVIMIPYYPTPSPKEQRQTMQFCVRSVFRIQPQRGATYQPRVKP